MTNRNYSTYDAFFTFELLNKVIEKSGNSEQQILTKLKTIEKEMKRVSNLPSGVAVKPATSSTSNTTIKLCSTDCATSRARTTDKCHKAHQEARSNLHTSEYWRTSQACYCHKHRPAPPGRIRWSLRYIVRIRNSRKDEKPKESRRKNASKHSRMYQCSQSSSRRF